MQPTEYEEQCNLVYWLRVKKIKHFAPNNENNSHMQNRKYAMIAEVKAKKSGKIKGIPDIFIFLPNKLLVIELKRSGKVLKSGKVSYSHTKTSKEQLECLKWLTAFEYVEGKVCYGWVEAKEFIEENMV